MATRPFLSIRKVLALAAVMFGAAGCPKDAPTGGGAASGGGAPPGGKKMVVALIPKGTTQSYWQTVKAGAEKAAREAGADLVFQGPTSEQDTNGQRSIIEAQVTKGVDAIVLAACDSEMHDVIGKAQGAGIPVVTIDSGVDVDKDTSVKFFATDNRAGGAKAADALAELVGPGGGAVGLIPFVQGAQSSDDRENGFKDRLAEKHPQLKLVSTLYSNSDVGEGLNKANAMLTAHPDLKGLFAANQAGGVGAAQALEQKRLAGKVKLVAYDAGDEEIAALKAGTIQALVVQQPFEMGYRGVREALSAAKSRTVRSDRRVMEDTGVEVVTTKNFEEPAIQKLLFPLRQKP